MPNWGRNLLIALLSVTVTPCTEASQAQRFDDPEQVLRFINTNPHDADLRQLWDTLNIQVDPDDRDCTCDSRTCGSCSARELRPSQTPFSSRVCAVRVSFLGDTSTYYLIYLRHGAWHFAYCIASPHNKYTPAVERYETDGRHLWLVINEFWGGGSGGLRRGEVWYELGSTRTLVALRRPASGHMVYDQPDDYEFTSEATLDVGNGPTMLTATYRVRSQAESGDDLVWRRTDEYRFVYHLDPFGRRFVLEKRLSVLPEPGAAFLKGDPPEMRAQA